MEAGPIPGHLPPTGRLAVSLLPPTARMGVRAPNERKLAPRVDGFGVLCRFHLGPPGEAV
jgi:hypothetical protein